MKPVVRFKKNLILAMLLLIRGYQWFISPLLGPRCRFHPRCSDYAKQAINTHGPVQGSLLAIKRILRCHPWHEGGLDPVPTIKSTPCDQPNHQAH